MGAGPFHGRDLPNRSVLEPWKVPERHEQLAVLDAQPETVQFPRKRSAGWTAIAVRTVCADLNPSANGRIKPLMKIAVLGAWGNIGKRIVAEALHRGHAVTGVARSPAAANPPVEHFSIAVADVTDAAFLAKAIAGHDVVISAVGPAHGASPSLLADAARSLPAAARTAQVKRIVIIGGAGSLLVAPGLQLVDTPDFPPAWRPVALAHLDALALWRAVSDLDWTYVSPAAMIAPGTRTGNYQSGDDLLLVDAEGQSRISMEDFAVAVLDLVEQGSHKRQRVTFAN